MDTENNTQIIRAMFLCDYSAILQSKIPHPGRADFPQFSIRKTRTLHRPWLKPGQ